MTKNNNPYKAAIEQCQQQLKNSQNLLDDPSFADSAMQELVQEEILQIKMN
jgi:hypothetical protein